jgi:hypothetical protein
LPDPLRLPNLLVIGAMKCGTSSLHRYLDLHPEISMSADKELHFFTKPAVAARGLAWYARQFSGGTPCRGESSVSYAKCHAYPGTAARIRAALPDLRLIYLVRDPVERTVSHYLHSVRQRRETRPLAEALAGAIENKYTLTSRYMLQLDDYLRHFAASDLLVVELAELAADPNFCMRRIFRFLGVDEGVTSAGFATVHNRTAGRGGAARPGPLARLAPRVRALGRHLIGSAAPPLPALPAGPALDPELRDRLAEYFRPDIARLEQFTGLRFPAWCGAASMSSGSGPRAALAGATG